jgi:NhaP-type Na+/H+ or K+/H+ antiporter
MSINSYLVIFLFGGYLFASIFKKIKLPAVLGMVVFGIVISLFFKDDAPKLLWDIEPSLKSFALIVILLRAGLGINREMLKKAGINAILMSFVPALLEGTALTLSFYYLFDFNFNTAALTAFMISAVSPAVIVPAMLDLKDSGFGKKREVPTAVLAGASVDDVFSITLFTLFLGAAVNGVSSPLKALIQIPISLLIGVLLGVVVGFLLTYFLKKRSDSVRATEKTLILLTAAMLLVEVGNATHSAALLGVMTTAFIIFERTPKVASELSQKLSKIWIFAEIILFVLIGFSVDIPTVIEAGGMGIIIIFIGLIFRSIGVIFSTSFGEFSWKERWFCVIAYTPKATVQAALGSVALHAGVERGEEILALALLSIVITAPLGLIGINISGKKLLTTEE